MAEVSLLLSGPRALPYVYRLTHRETGRFYIGLRCANVRLGKRAEDDLGKSYKSSASKVREAFHEYDALVVAECFTRESACSLERELIEAEIGNPLLINKAVWKVGYRGPFVGPTRGMKLSDEHKRKIGSAHRGMKRSEETRRNISAALTGKKIVWSDERRRKFHETTGGRDLGPEWRKNLSEGQRRRFQSQDQRESNRRAAVEGYWARMKNGFKVLRVSSSNGRVSVLYSSAGSYAKAAGIHQSAIFRRANEFSGIESTRGKLKGLAFSWVE